MGIRGGSLLILPAAMDWRIRLRKEMRVGMPRTCAHTSSISMRWGEISTVPTQYRIPANVNRFLVGSYFVVDEIWPSGG